MPAATRMYARTQ